MTLYPSQGKSTKKADAHYARQPLFLLFFTAYKVD